MKEKKRKIVMIIDSNDANTTITCDQTVAVIFQAINILITGVHLLTKVSVVSANVKSR